MAKRSTKNDRSDAFFLLRAKWAAGEHEEAIRRAKHRLGRLKEQGPIAEAFELVEFLQNAENVASVVHRQPSSDSELDKEIRRRVDEAWPDAKAGDIANDVRFSFEIPNVRGNPESDRIYRMAADYIDWRRSKDDGQTRMVG